MLIEEQTVHGKVADKASDGTAAATPRKQRPLGLAEGSLVHWLSVTALFFALAIVQTWPLVLNIDDRVMAWAPDSYANTWSLWWVKEQVLDLSNPFRSDLLYYPQGTDLYLHTLSPVNGLLSIPLQVATNNLLLSWNVLVIFFFTASGVGGYALAYRVSRDLWASLAGGVIFAFMPFVLTHLHGHFNIATTFPIPFFALSVLKLHETKKLRFAIIAGVLLSVMTWNWIEFAIDSGLFLVLFAAFWAFIYFRRNERDALVSLVKGAVVVLAVWLPLSVLIIVPSLYEAAAGEVSMNGGLSQPAEYYSADLLGYVTPSPLWGPGRFSEGDFGGFPTPIGGVEGTVYLGILPLLLSAFAVVGLWRTEGRLTVAFWGLVFAFFAVMALGPYLYIDGDKTFTLLGLEFSISLPFRVFKELPLIGLRRVPARMVVYAVLALSVLAPLGLVALRRYTPLRSPAAGQALAVVALALVLLEFWNPPVSTNSFDLPPIYERIGQEDGDFALLELPVGRITGTVQRGDIIGGAMADYSQITHGKATVGGYVSRAKEDHVIWLREEPGIGYLSCPTCPDYPRRSDVDRDLVRGIFTDLKIKYVIVNLQTFEGEPTSYVTDRKVDEVRDYLENVLLLESVGSGDGWFAYRNPDVR